MTNSGEFKSVGRRAVRLAHMFHIPNAGAQVREALLAQFAEDELTQLFTNEDPKTHRAEPRVATND